MDRTSSQPLEAGVTLDRLVASSTSGRDDAPISHLALQVSALVALLVVAVVALILQYHENGNGYMTDDAFISFRYANNLADGHGPVWTPGDRVEGYTNFGWVLLLAGARIVFGMSPITASQRFGVLASAATLALVPLLVAQLRSAWSIRWWAIVVGATLALALNTGFSLWSFAGLETTAFTFLVTAAVTLHLYEERTLRRPLLSSPVFVLAALTRPDAIVFWAVSMLFKLPRLLSGERRNAMKMLAAAIALFAVPFDIYWCWRWSYYGDFYPNTYYLKAEQSRAMLDRGWEYAWHFFAVYWMFLLAFALVSVWLERSARYRPATCLLALSAAWFVYVVDAGGDWMPYYRFLVPLLPFVYIAIVHGAIDALDIATKPLRWLPLRYAAMAGVAIVVAFSAYRPEGDAGARNPAGFVANTQVLPGDVDLYVHKQIGDWMRQNLPADYTVALIASGIVPYYSGLPTIDMLGVNDRLIAHKQIPLGHGVAGHEKADGGYVISRKPEIIWLNISLEDEPRDSIDDYMLPAFTDRVGVKTQIIDNAYVWFLYRPAAIRFGTRWLNLLVLNDVDLPVLPAPLRGSEASAD